MIVSNYMRAIEKRARKQAAGGTLAIALVRPGKACRGRSGSGLEAAWPGGKAT